MEFKISVSPKGAGLNVYFSESKAIDNNYANYNLCIIVVYCCYNNFV